MLKSLTTRRGWRCAGVSRTATSVVAIDLWLAWWRLLADNGIQSELKIYYTAASGMQETLLPRADGGYSTASGSASSAGRMRSSAECCADSRLHSCGVKNCAMCRN